MESPLLVSSEFGVKFALMEFNRWPLKKENGSQKRKINDDAMFFSGARY